MNQHIFPLKLVYLYTCDTPHNIGRAAVIENNHLLLTNQIQQQLHLHVQVLLPNIIYLLSLHLHYIIPVLCDCQVNLLDVPILVLHNLFVLLTGTVVLCTAGFKQHEQRGTHL